MPKDNILNHQGSQLYRTFAAICISIRRDVGSV